MAISGWLDANGIKTTVVKFFVYFPPEPARQ